MQRIMKNISRYIFVYKTITSYDLWPLESTSWIINLAATHIIPGTYEDLCGKSRYQEQGQVITSHSICGM